MRKAFKEMASGFAVTTTIGSVLLVAAANVFAARSAEVTETGPSTLYCSGFGLAAPQIMKSWTISYDSLLVNESVTVQPSGSNELFYVGDNSNGQLYVSGGSAAEYTEFHIAAGTLEFLATVKRGAGDAFYKGKCSKSSQL